MSQNSYGGGPPRHPSPRMMSPNHPMNPGGNYGPRMGGGGVPRPMGGGGVVPSQPGMMGGSYAGSNNAMMTSSPAGGEEDKMQVTGANPTPPPSQQQQQPPPQQQTKEINTATVCLIGQETVQEIVSRIQEVFSYLKSLQPPVGSNIQERDRHTMEKQQRLQEVLKGIVQLFKRLKVCWEKCQENTVGMEYALVENLIPIKDERDIKAELEKKRGESYRQAFEEHDELSQLLVMKNRHLKEIIDQMRNIIWEINTMLAMRD